MGVRYFGSPIGRDAFQDHRTAIRFSSNVFRGHYFYRPSQGHMAVEIMPATIRPVFFPDEEYIAELEARYTEWVSRVRLSRDLRYLLVENDKAAMAAFLLDEPLEDVKRVAGAE